MELAPDTDKTKAAHFTSPERLPAEAAPWPLLSSKLAKTCVTAVRKDLISRPREGCKLPGGEEVGRPARRAPEETSQLPGAAAWEMTPQAVKSDPWRQEVRQATARAPSLQGSCLAFPLVFTHSHPSFPEP